MCVCVCVCLCVCVCVKELNESDRIYVEKGKRTKDIYIYNVETDDAFLLFINSLYFCQRVSTWKFARIQKAFYKKNYFKYENKIK